MMKSFLISNDRQAHEAEAAIADLDTALSSEQTLKSIVSGLPQVVVEGVRRSLATERRELRVALDAYEEAKRGDAAQLKKLAVGHPGVLLIAARIVRRLSQKELARKLGLQEQQVQRYEAERYESISLARYQKVARVLGVRVSGDIEPRDEEWAIPCRLPSSEELSRVLRHARANRWLEEDEPDEKALSQLKRQVAEHISHSSTPSLLRTGLNVINHKDDWALLFWKAQVSRVAEQIIGRHKPSYRPSNVSWLVDLVQLSRLDDGPVRARDMLLKHGIVLVIEPHITGMKVDGAAFLVDGVPVIGMTLLRDSLDNFWFTLLHEIAHVVLHYRIGLATGFFDDDVTATEVDELEKEANDFAGNLLLPDEVWRRSPARIAKTAEPVEKLAQQLGIHPSIVFGRIRLERGDYSLFSNKIARGLVRRQLMAQR